MQSRSHAVDRDFMSQQHLDDTLTSKSEVLPFLYNSWGGSMKARSCADEMQVPASHVASDVVTWRVEMLNLKCKELIEGLKRKFAKEY
jgi:hypothetical protein